VKALPAWRICVSAPKISTSISKQSISKVCVQRKIAEKENLQVNSFTACQEPQKRCLVLDWMRDNVGQSHLFWQIFQQTERVSMTEIARITRCQISFRRSMKLVGVIAFHCVLPGPHPQPAHSRWTAFVNNALQIPIRKRSG
jgi:hypothetical protein